MWHEHRRQFATDYTVEFSHPKPTHSFGVILQTVIIAHNAVSAAICKCCYDSVMKNSTALWYVFVNVAVDTLMLLLLYVSLAACVYCCYV